MDRHFAAFSFVDRITSLDPGRRARGCFAVPGHVRGFPPCLVAEAVGQLAAWAAMSHIDFRGRPVAALATETVFHGEVRPGQMLELSVDIDSCDDEAVAYSGRAQVGGVLSIELNDCLGPMLPVADFDAPEALRERLDLLCTAGAHPGRFAGLDEPELVAIDGTSTAALRAQLAVPRTAAFFADHFPRRPVFPATLLLDAQIRLAMRIPASPSDAGSSRVPRRMTHVKMRSFILPGQTAQLLAERMPSASEDALTSIKLSATVESRTVATARLEIGPKEGA